MEHSVQSLSPKSLECTDKSKKYDRQLRLWGDNGQAALESSHVCLINATSLGTEILKSLVLPGIAAFTLIDAAKITEEDIAANFFLDTNSVGKLRAEIALQMLLELNPDVQGDYVDDTVENLLQNDPNFFASFAVVIATSLTERETIAVSQNLWNLGIPFIVGRSYGFMGYARMQVQEHTIVESHPDNQMPDLRLDSPFPSLKAYFDSIDLDSMDLKDHAHVPYVVVLYKCLEEYKSMYGPLLRTSKEKNVLKKIISEGIKKDENGVPHAEENFEEAIRAVNFAVTPAEIPENTKRIFNDENCVSLTGKSKPFWIVARAVKDFTEAEGCGMLPVRGTLPDMTADTKRYIEVQKIYREKASNDADVVYRKVQKLLHHLSQPSDLITEDYVKLFCKCSNQLHVVRTSCISNEYSAKHVNSSFIASELEDPDSIMECYILLRAVERYYTEYREYPGELDDHVESDIIKLKACVSKILSEYSCSSTIKDDIIYEFCRYGAADIHTVSAFLGGCLAHEVIKLVTKQYTPFTNTLVYNAITSNVAVFQL